MTTQEAESRIETGGDHTAGARTQVVGLVLLALAPLTMFAIEVVAGFDASEFMIPLTIGTLLLAGAWLAGRFGTWSKIVGILLTLLTVLAGFWLAFGLSAIASPADFVPAVLFVLGVGLSLMGGIQAIRARNRPGVGVAPAEGRARSLPAVSAVVVVLAAAVSLTAHVAGRQTVDVAAAADAAPVTMGAFAFTDAQVTVAAGPDAALLVSNRDAFLHDLAIPEHGIAATVNPGSQALLDVSGLAAGTYTFYCTLHSDTRDPDPASAGMAGTLVVQ